MPSSAELPAPGKTNSRRVAGAFEVWNRKLHFYSGLYLLLSAGHSRSPGCF